MCVKCEFSLLLQGNLGSDFKQFKQDSLEQLEQVGEVQEKRPEPTMSSSRFPGKEKNVGSVSRLRNYSEGAHPPP